MLKDIDYESEYEQLKNHFRALLNFRIKNNKTTTQKAVGKALQKTQNAVNNWINSNDKKQSLPNTIDFLLLCKVLDLRPDFFLETGSLTEIIRYSEETNENEIPFIETSVSRKLEELLLNRISPKKVITIITLPKNGISRAIKEFTRQKNARLVDNIETELRSIPKKCILIFEHTDWMTHQDIENVIDKFLNRNPIAFIIKSGNKNEPLFLSGQEAYHIGSINRGDLIKITKQMLPNFPDSKIPIVEAEARGRIDELVTTLQKIKLGFKKYSNLSSKQIVEVLYP